MRVTRSTPSRGRRRGIGSALAASLLLSGAAGFAGTTVAAAAPGDSAAAAPAPAAAAADDRTFTLVGNLQSELGCAADWDPTCADTVLAATDVPGVYSADIELPAGEWEYKVTVNGSFDESYGREGGADNAPLTVAGTTTLRVTFDDTTKRIGLTPLDLAGEYTEADDALVSAPVRQPGAEEVFYFVMTDRFANGDTSNDTAGIAGGRLDHGFDPTDKGFYQGGDIAGLHENLDYIEDLGTTAIWLTPSFENRPVQGTGADASAGYHGYWITDFTQIDPHLGTNAELEALIDDAHERDIKVYFDIITNHTADVIDYAEGEYSYVDAATSPYTDAAGEVFDPADYAGTDDFPALDPATSFPYTPVLAGANADAKTPDWLNDPTLYHNRGNSTWSGESVTFGDFDGLDDLMTEHPQVVDGMVDVYDAWVDLGIDGFRIDTVKHVNTEFWDVFTQAVSEHATAQGRPDFFMFGEVYDADPKLLSPYVRNTDMDSVLDFYFQQQAISFSAGNAPSTLAALFAGDDYYTTPTTSASALPTFLGNHDMGRAAYYLRQTDDPLQRTQLAHELMFLTRGQPVVYYGDEQGFVGDGDLGGKDKDARQSLFATQVPEFAEQNLVTGEVAGSVDRYDTDAPLYTAIADLSQLRTTTPALSDGAQIERLVDATNGVYAFSRVDRDERIEHLVVTNNAATARTVFVPALTSDAAFTPLFGETVATSSDADGLVSVSVPARSAVVLVADEEVSTPAEVSDVALTAPSAGAAIDGVAPVAVAVDDSWRETSFAWRVVGDDAWTALGTAEDTTPRVFHTTDGLADGTLVEYRAVTVDASGATSAASTFASVGTDVTTAAPTEPEQPTYDMVTVPGSHNSEMGCAADWQPDCADAALTLRPDGIWAGTFDLPAGDYEYKVAVNGSWDVNFGVGGVPGGGNALYTHAGGEITFYFDPVSKQFSNTSQGPIVSLAGNLQSELGCTADWMPGELCAWLTDSDGDGTYTFSTDALPTGAYEIKVVHGVGWGENYGADGVRDGQNILFSATEGSITTFSYDIATHLLTITAENPPLAGTGTLQAHWVTQDLLAWPSTLGAPAAGATWTLHHSADASLAVTDGAVTGGEAVALTPVSGGLPADVAERFPALAGYTVLRAEGLSRADAASILTEQVWVTQSSGGELTAATGVQIPGVLDDLYADGVADASLGLVFSGASAAATLWAPTAQDAVLLRTPAGAAAGTTPTEVAATRDDATGTWTTAASLAVGDLYSWRVSVYAPSTGAVETNEVSDPYSVALTTNSTSSVVVDLAADDLKPELWEDTAAPIVDRPVDRAIYELHVRDFSIGDTTVPEAERGTYKAFTRTGSAGMTHLAELADAGINTVHLLPTFDIASIEEDRAAQTTPDCDLVALSAADPAGEAQQACVGAQRDTDGYNWGYDPYHFLAPEGSYAAEPEGGARVAEFREMVGGLHATGLQVVLDQVYNHTAASGQAATSVLDQVVPGYYHRLDANGSVQTSTCCQNIATEHEVAQKLMVDAVVLWARDYRVDGFRFDLMGHHSRENMLAVRAALDELTLAEDGVDGSSVYLYGEGWNFGEVADNALFEQATQGQLGGTGIGTFNDRLRDGVHGGSPVDGSSTFDQGFGTGLGTDPNGRSRTGSAELGGLTDLVKLGLAGNLADYELTAASGETVRGDELDYRGAPAGYAVEPDEVINYVDAHDNETLYDIGVLKLPADTPMADRVRMNTLSLATVALSQSPSFWHAGTELLRSKSLDRDSYNSGDWFNRIDWTGQDSTFGSGLPGAWSNEEKWADMRPLLADPALKPAPADMAASNEQALELLRVRGEVDLLRLGSGDLIKEKVSFPASGPDAAAGTVVMLVDDTVGESVSDTLDSALVVFNASPDAVTFPLTDLAGREYALTAAQADGSDAVVKATAWDAATGALTVPARSYVVLVEEADGVAPAPEFTDVSEDNQFFTEITWLAERGISTGWPNADGTAEYRPLLPVARDAMAAFLFRLLAPSDYEPPTTSPFVDVATTNQFYAEIAWLHESGISTGWARGDGTFEFRPLAPIARDAMAAFLYRAADSPEFTPPAVSPFQDVAPGDQFYAEIAWMKSTEIGRGWIGNDGRDYYQPLNPVARDAMAAFLFRFYDKGFAG
ncbi:pullulanase-type alpha-1,6-glucosidase [Serinibacter arcticus]|uniref:Neopullulanase n=1 Tax=Serinibacter arcticus TaxID=1655435 RepID=A0A4Z1E866_9MICO|nr:pullulanase-type alpha-1,6-glucosidase [Serinibacter arcticus]TGO05777.1 Neopullulanase [Serinibacter arcticus]